MNESAGESSASSVGADPNKTGTTEPYVEQGISVFAISDYEWYAAADFEGAWQAALTDWGFTDPNEIAEHRECADERRCNLDKTTIMLNQDEDEPERMTYRAWLKELIANGASFPSFFAAIDG